MKQSYADQYNINIEGLDIEAYEERYFQQLAEAQREKMYFTDKDDSAS